VVYVTGSDLGDAKVVPGAAFVAKPYSPAALVALCTLDEPGFASDASDAACERARVA